MMLLKLSDNADYVVYEEIFDWYLSKGLRLEDVTIKQKLEYSKKE